MAGSAAHSPTGGVPDFETIFQQYGRRVYGLVQRLVGAATAEDATQEVWIAVYRALPRYRGEARLSTWLFSLTARQCSKWRRRQRAEAEELSDELPAPDPPPEARLLTAELASRVRGAIDALPEHQRVAVHLRLVEGCSYAEVAAILAIPVGTVRSRLHHGTARLAAQLAPYLAPTPLHDADQPVATAQRQSA
ncbi:MAG: sigma-70 family RNA polymerase sigma factor [Fimbriimonadaceae bacterium]|nr:sigma-70 family RNA polymerase sigma factor [Fimbriimonadaceae bacterium]